MEKGSLIRIIIALLIICLYVFLFGIMGTIESIELSLPQEETFVTEQKITAPAVTSGVDENGKAVFTYATEINVINARKPSLIDYTGTQAILVIPSEEETTEAATETTTTPAADFSMKEEDFDYTLPPVTTAVTTEATTAASVQPTVIQIVTQAPETTAAATTVTTTTTAQTTTETTAASTEPPASVPAEDDDIYDITEEDADTTRPAGDDTIPGEEDTRVTPETMPPESEDEEETDAPAEEAPQTEAPVNSSALSETFTVNAAGTIISDSALNIVSMAVMAEISDIFDEEAIKAQAIATYTYIKYYNDNNQYAYIAKSTPSDKVVNCVKQVLGKVIYYNGEIIQAVYGASTAGRTASSKAVWGVDYPYLISKDTKFIDEAYDINYGRKVTFTSEEIKNYVMNATGIVLSGDPSEWIKIESYTDEVYVGQMSIGGHRTYNNGTKDVAITGRVFREKILDYDIRSASFQVEYDAASDSFNFTTYGYGHCVGFSQHGANILATYFGYDYEDILQFYYPGTTIS